MSAKVETLFEELSYLRMEEGVFPPAIIEEFALKGTSGLDYKYIMEMLGERTSVSAMEKIALRTVGTNFPEFRTLGQNENEISEAEFLERYEFGKYRNVRAWITDMYLANDNRCLTRAQLFKYLHEPYKLQVGVNDGS